MMDLFLTLATPARIFYSILLGLDAIVYELVDIIYSVFITICNTQLFSATTFEAFSSRIYAILGVVMLFVVASQLLVQIADPDKATSGEASTGKLVTNILISLIAIVLVPTAFKYLYRIQNAIVKENIIGNIIVGGYDSSGAEGVDQATIIKNTGKDLAFNTFIAFINPAGYAGDNDTGCNNIPGLTYCLQFSKINSYGSNDYGKIKLLNQSQVANEIDKGDVEYRWGISTVAGIMVIYFLLSFSIDMGVRVAKLAYYQLIAPVPIVLRIIPKKQDVFDNWIKGLMNTYLGVFVRLMVVYFGIFLINIIPSAWANISNANSNRSIVNLMVSILLIFGVFIFMKEAPKLISQMLGVGEGDMSLGIGKKLAGAAVIGAPLAKYGKKAYGGLTGALGGGWDAMMNGEKFGAGFRTGGLGGWDKGGRQFGAQRAELYKSRTGDYKGKPGFFGGKSWGTLYRGATGEYQDAAFQSGSDRRTYGGPNGREYLEFEHSIQQDLVGNYINERQMNPTGRFANYTDSEIIAFADNEARGIASGLVSDLNSSDERVARLARDNIRGRYTADNKAFGGRELEALSSVGSTMAKESKYSTEKAKRKSEKDFRRVAGDIFGGGTPPAGGGTPPAGGGGTPPAGGGGTP